MALLLKLHIHISKKIRMKTFNGIKSLLLIVLMAFSLSSCELVGDILEVGIWLGIILVVAVIAIIYWIFKKLSK